MALSIRNPRIENLARSISAREGRSMTEVIGSALEKYEKMEDVDLFELAKKLNAELRAGAPKDFVGRNMTKDEISAMWMD